MSFWGLLARSSPVLGLMAVGFAVRRLRWLTSEAEASLLRLVVNLLYPCLVFGSVVGNEAARSPQNLITAPAAGVASLMAGFAVAWGVGRLIRLRRGPERRTFTFVVGIQNYGYVPIPIVQALFPGALGVLFVFSLGVELTLWTAGIAIVSGASGAGLWRKALSPTVLAIFLGLAIGLLGLAPAVPMALLTGIHMLGGCAVPLALLLIGGTIFEELARAPVVPANLEEVPAPGATRRRAGAGAGLRPGQDPSPAARERARVRGLPVVVGHLVRLGVLPLLLLLATRELPLSEELRQVMVVQAAMPAAVLPIVLTKHHRGDVGLAVSISVGTNVLALLSIPLWIRLGMLIVGL